MRVLFIFLILKSFVLSHTLVLNLMDNEDGTIQISSMFNTGQSAAGALVKAKLINSDKIIYEKRLPEEGEINFKIPNSPYLVILDGGPGHSIQKEGIPPKEGYKEDIKKQKKIAKQSNNFDNKILVKLVLWFISFLLIILIVFLYFKNTRRLEEMNKFLKI